MKLNDGRKVDNCIIEMLAVCGIKPIKKQKVEDGNNIWFFSDIWIADQLLKKQQELENFRHSINVKK